MAVGLKSKTKKQTKMEDKNLLFFQKYKALILSVALFVLMIVFLLGLNAYATRQIAIYRAQTQAVTEMQIAIESAIRNLYDLKLYWGEDPESPHINSSLNQLTADTAKFDEINKALQSGGVVKLADNIIIDMTSVSKDDNVAEYSKTIQSAWVPLYPSIKDYLKDAREITATELTLDVALSQLQSAAPKLTASTAEISKVLAGRAEQASKFLSRAQYIGIALTILYFFIFVLYFIRKLLSSDKQAAEARRETSEILDTIQEGLFLVDEDFVIGSKQSKAVEKIFPGIKMEHQKISSVLKNILNDKDIADTQSYISQLFKPRVKESLIRSLNPLNKIQVFFDNGQGVVEDRYLKFDFNRVYDGQNIKRILVSVADITKSVELEQRLEQEREQNNRQIELLVKVLRVDPKTLASFIRRGEQTTNGINSILRHTDISQAGLRKKVEDIFREIHSFKGEASALEFDQFVVISQEMESKLRNLREKTELNGDDFLTVAVSLDAIIEQLNTLKLLQHRLQSHQQGLTDDINSIREVSLSNNNQAINSYLSYFVEQVAQRNYKLVNVIIDGFEPLPFNESTTDTLKSIIVQLIRNAVVHGIETPERRKIINKTRQGNLAIHLRKKDDCYDLIVEDDGAGIDREALKERLRKIPNFNKDPDTLSQQELLRTIFISGVSTTDIVTEDAGQGVGMDVVLDRVRSLNAKIAVSSKENVFTRFVIRIPK